jgi:hypothetical protein
MKDTDVLAGSHLPILIKLVQMTTGPVLEMGIGWNSTPVLHWLCLDRRLLSLENDREWYEKFVEFGVGKHKIGYVKDWEKARIDNTRWSVVLIDHRPALRRHKDAIRLKDNADFIILHDSEPEIDKFYAYRRVWPHFKYRYDHTGVKPHTTVLSNRHDLRLRNL